MHAERVGVGRSGLPHHTVPVHADSCYSRFSWAIRCHDGIGRSRNLKMDILVVLIPEISKKFSIVIQS